MKNFKSLLLFSIFFIQGIFLQIASAQTLPTGWERIHINNLGSFDIPPTMEVQKGKYKEYVDEVKRIKGYEGTQLTVQQKGLNEFGKEAFEKYGRVIISTEFGSLGNFEKLNFNVAKFTETDLIEINQYFKTPVQNSFSSTGMKLIEWDFVRVEKVNGYSCFHISYKRQLEDKPVVLVNTYYFHNNDRMHEFTLSYRLLEASYWKVDFETILKSFRITNIK